MPPDSDKVRLIAEEESNDRIKSSDTKIEMGKDKKEAKEGDSLKGLNEQELDYLGSRGVGSVYLASLLSASHPTEVKGELGTLGDWASLAKGLQESGIKVIMDFGTSQALQQHVWIMREELRKVVEFWLHEGVDSFGIQVADEVLETLIKEFLDILDVGTVELGGEKILMTEDDTQRPQDFSSLGASGVVHLSLPGGMLSPDLPTAKGIKDKLDNFEELGREQDAHKSSINGQGKDF